MDQQERELLCDSMACAIDWSFREQTKHLVKAMPCLCSLNQANGQSRIETCNRCLKLKELEK